ncbi:MAG: hypothetical protein HGA44_07430 [Cellulomonadaceae bacterium]|nr:hypothetical protein [Cellulomonadaceae bacterium]
MEMLSGRVVARWLGAGAVGVVIGLVGTAVHRYSQPWGLVLALATVLVGGVLVRAWTGWVGMLALAMGVATTVAVLGGRGPGGDTLIPAEVVGYVWYCGAAVVALAGLAPARWFSDRPVQRRNHDGDAP